MGVETKNEADSTIYNTEKTLHEHKDKVPQEDQDAIKADIAAVKEAVSNENVSADELKEKVEALKKSSMKIGEAMYKNAGDGGSSGEQSAEYEDIKKDGDEKKE